MIYDNRLDPINTTLSNPPGARSAPFKYSVYEQLPKEIWESQVPSVSCDIATTAGDRQIEWCNPQKPNCPMSRNLEPTQRVDKDIVYCDRDGDVFGLNYKIKNKGPYSTEVVSPCKKRVKQYRRNKPKKRMSDTDLVIRIFLFIAFIVLLATLASKF